MAQAVNSSSRTQQIKCALNPDSVLIDGRDCRDRLAFAARFAELILYYNQDNQLSGSWQSFFVKDPVILLAVISKTDYTRDHMQFAQLQRNINQTTVANQSVYSASDQAVSGQSTSKLASSKPATSKQSQSNTSNSSTADSSSQSSNVVALSTAQCIRDNAESINALFALLERVFCTIDGWIKCMASTNQSYDLYTFMQKSIQDSIAKQLWKMVALQQYFSIKTRSAVLPPNTTAFNDFDSVWTIASSQKKPQSPLSVEKPFDALLDQLWSIYHKAFSFFLQVIDSAKQEFYDMKWQENDFPDTSLLISFSELMKTQQKQINLLSGQHLDFYYQDVLQQTLLGAKADQAFVCLELADNIDSLSLPAGTGFSAGVYPDKSTIVFVNDTQSDINRAKIGEVNTLYYLPSPNPSTLSGDSQFDNSQLGDVSISADSSATTATSSPAETRASNSSANDTATSTTADSAASDSTTDSSSSTASSTTTSATTSASPVVANTPTIAPTEAEIEALITPKLYLSTVTSATEVVKNQDQEIQSWDAFGNTDGISVQQGFAFGSPMLFLQGGIRTLTITLTLDEMLPTSYFNLSQFYLSTKKDWFEVSATNIQASELVDNNVIILQIILSEADPAIEAFTKNPDGLSCDWPMFKVMMAASIDLEQHVLLNSVSIQTDVTNFSQFSMGNTTSILPNTGPVQVLGPIPELGSYFYMGSNECFAKPLSSLTLVQEWDNIPSLFRDYYAPYNAFLDPDGSPPKDHFNNTAFMGNWSLLEGRSWKILPTQTGTPPPVQMFQQTTPLAVPPALPTKNLPQSTFDFKFDATGTSTTPGVFSLSAPNPDLVKAVLPLIEKAQSGYIRFTLCQPAHAFGNDLYPKVVSDITLKNAEILIKKAEGGGTVAKIMKAVEDAVKSVMKGVSKVVGAITGVVKKLLKTVGSAIKSIVGLVEKAIKTIIGLIKKIIGSVLGLLGKIIKGTVSGIGKIAKGIFNGLKKIVTAPFSKKDKKDSATEPTGAADTASDSSATSTDASTATDASTDTSTTSAADSTDSASTTDSVTTVDTTKTDDDTLQPMPNTPYSPKQTALVVSYNATQLTPINDSAQTYPLDIFHYGSFKPYQVYDAVSPKNSIGWSNLVPESLAKEQASAKNSGTGAALASSTQTSTQTSEQSSSTTNASANNSLTSSTSAPKKTLPLFTGVSGQGCLYIGLKEVVAPCAITLYVELNQDVDVTELNKDSVGYFYWGESGWEALNVLENDTNNLNCSGIIKFEVPQLTAAQVITLQTEMSASAAEATGTTATTGTKDTADAGTALSYFPSPIMPNSDFWLAIATQKKNVNVKFSYMNTQAIKLQRSDVEQVPNGETPEIDADIIAALLEKNAKVSTIAQPFPSFNGAPAENNDNYLSRVSQRLESKDRSSSKTNYDDMAHTAYRTLYYAKTLNGTKPGKIRIGLVNSYANSSATNAFRPLVSACQQYTIQSYIASRISAMASVEVFNLKHQVLTVTAHLSLISEGNANAVLLQLNQDLKMYLSPWIQSDQPQADIENGVNRSDLVTLLTRSSSVAGVISLQVMLSPIPTPLGSAEEITTSATSQSSTSNATTSTDSGISKDTEITSEIITPQQDNAILVSATKHNLFSVSPSTDSGILNLTPSNELEVAQ